MMPGKLKYWLNSHSLNKKRKSSCILGSGMLVGLWFVDIFYGTMTVDSEGFLFTFVPATASNDILYELYIFK